MYVLYQGVLFHAFRTKNIQFLPSSEKFPLTQFGQNNDNISRT